MSTEKMDTNAISIGVMSGVEDGTVLMLESRLNGSITEEGWTISIGRREENDVCLRNDTYVSRYHALVHQRSGSWWLEDCNSKNGTFIEDADEDARVSGIIPIEPGQYFRVGRTWLRLQA
jgi:pSer/pThr/pTyr-binding forkhead associated (FHA) protein